MRLRTLISICSVLASLLVGAGSAVAADPQSSDGYVFQKVSRAPLGDSKQSVLEGKRNADGSCHYDYPEITVSEPGVTIEVRDLGIDQARCRKIIEQGVSAEVPGGPGKGEEQITQEIHDLSQTAGSSQSLLATSTASGYNWTWWEDILGIKMTQDRTNISWSYNGSCSLVGSSPRYRTAHIPSASRPGRRTPPSAPPGMPAQSPEPLPRGGEAERG